MTQNIAFVDLEGVLFPEMWPAIASACGDRRLEATTRDVPCYEELMSERIKLLKENEMDLSAICSVVKGLNFFDGALDFVSAISQNFKVIIVTDSFSPMNIPALQLLEVETVFTNRFESDANGLVTHCHYWHEGRGKVAAFDDLNPDTTVVAIGDGFNDLEMLQKANLGILFRPSDRTKQSSGDLLIGTDLSAAKTAFTDFIDGEDTSFRAASHGVSNIDKSLMAL